ncbi:hypothetical protein AURDEDRAFT_188849 [Auricularia subglabra TFB-10046 SS5]|uniref:BTB domain-containing protein n=1 Tax=Auricularia subglabra (strain TFB-10046 / SS5) TaxID=717982 RepID=J0WQZ5_AURST|nr:hypothetical protein AURDEDRAFT_188849 [Auricularia subglabra TFB-10046 SS5]
MTPHTTSGDTIPGVRDETKQGAGDLARQHPKFWFEDGNITLQVDDTKFKLHRSLLSLSCGTFHDMFSVGGDAVSHEATDEHPLLLPGQSPNSFELLCRAIYANWGDTQKLGVEDLAKLLSVAHFYNAHDIYTRTVAELGRMPLSLVDRMVYAQRFSIDEWTGSAFVALAQSMRKLSDKEAGMIGWRLAWQLASAQKMVVHKRLTRALLATNPAGCCDNCQIKYIRPSFGHITVLLTGDPVNASQDVDGYLTHLRAELKTRCPGVGACGNINCATWPTLEHVKKWLDLSGEEQLLREMLAPLNV